MEELLKGININEGCDEKALKLISLFQPFPISDNADNFILKSRGLSDIYDMDEFDMAKLKSHLVSEYSNSILEVSSTAWNIRPYPLAIRLASMWFDNHNSSLIFNKIIEDINAMPEPPQKRIIECLVMRLEDMDESEAAQDLVEKITAEGQVFRSENVINTDLGSQLILAMSTVNPSATVSCLYDVITSNPLSWILSLAKEVRRNLVWSLTKLISYNESFYKAGVLLGRLALVETEKYLDNNSKGLFEQLFHAWLSGTSSSLEDRLELIRYINNPDSEYYSLLPIALKGALYYGSFSRTSSRKYSIDKDYSPSISELYDYWRECSKICLELLRANIYSKDIIYIVRMNLPVWIRGGFSDLFYPLIEYVIINHNVELDLVDREWYNILRKLEKQDNEFYCKYSKLTRYIIPDNFLSKLKKVVYHFQGKIRFSYSDYFQKLTEEFDEITNEFLENNLYISQDDINSLCSDKENISHYFVPVLSRKIRDEQLEALYKVLWHLAGKDKDFLDCMFLVLLISNTKEREVTKSFLSKLLNPSYFEYYIKLKSRCEDENLSVLDELDERFSKLNEGGFISLYLENATLYEGNSMTKLLNFLNNKFVNHPNTIMDFIVHSMPYLNKLDSVQISYIKNMVIDFPVENTLYNLSCDFWEYAESLLNMEYDSNLAEALNRKYIDNFSNIIFSHGIENLYRTLLESYATVIWPSLSSALFDKDFGLFSVLNEHIGSGFSFGEGPFFKVEKNLIYEVLANYPETAPYRIAHMCPIFQEEKKDGKTQFSEWVIYLLDNYSESDYVFDGLNENLGTYQWSGGMKPLLEKKLEAFNSLANHPKIRVREWVSNNLSELKKELMRVIGEADFERMHYGRSFS